MIAIALAHRLADWEHISDQVRGFQVACTVALGRCWRRIGDLVQPGCKCGLDFQSIQSRKAVFEWEDPMRPNGKSFRLRELRQLRNQLLLKFCRGVLREREWFGLIR